MSHLLTTAFTVALTFLQPTTVIAANAQQQIQVKSLVKSVGVLVSNIDQYSAKCLRKPNPSDTHEATYNSLLVTLNLEPYIGSIEKMLLMSSDRSVKSEDV